MSNDSQESPCGSSRPRLYPSVLTQMQIERLKKEDEEEHWISGEELYTEGSSDDDDDDDDDGSKDDKIMGEASAAELTRHQVQNIRSNKIVENRSNLNRTKKIADNNSFNNSIITPPPRSASGLQHEINSKVFNKKLKINQLQHIQHHHHQDSNSPAETIINTPASFASSSLTSSSSPTIIIPPAAELENEKLSSVEKIQLTAAAADDRRSKIDDRRSSTTISKIESEEDEEKEEEEEDEEEESVEQEISWRPKREDELTEERNLMFEETIVELKELQFEYNSEILNSLSDLKTSLLSSRSLNRLISTSTTAVNYYSTDEKEGKSSATIIEDVSFSELIDVRRWSNAVVDTVKIKNEIVNMVKLDTCIDELYEKVKKAREETLQEQITNREELKKLQSLRTPESGKLAKNSLEFIKLCNNNINNNSMEIENYAGDEELITNFDDPVEEEIYLAESDSQSAENLEKSHGLTICSKSTKKKEDQSRKSQREKLEEELKLIEKRKINFIDRNKELASCSMGTLAITDDEKKRLEKLVDEEGEEEEEEFITDEIINSSTSISTPYTIDKDADELLKNLTEQIENINSETYRKSEKEGPKICREEFMPQKEQILLNSLKILSESNSKIIHPISEDEIRALINEYYAEHEEGFKMRFSNDFKNTAEINFDDESTSSVSTISENLTITRETVDELVKEAKNTMPFFKFNNEVELFEKIEDEDKNEVENEKL